MEKDYLNKWNEITDTPTNSYGEEIKPRNIKIDGDTIEIDGEKYDYLDSNDRYHLYLDKNGNPQEIRIDGYYDSEIL